VTAPAQVDLDTAAYALRLGDDALVLGQRLCEWAARSPQLEEDVALLNLALDHLGAARCLLTRAGELEGAGRDEDDLAFLRHEREFTNALLCELEVGDFGRTMARQLLVAAWQLPLWTALTGSADEVLAGVAGKAVKEVDYHLDHARTWVLRLGDGTIESRRRVQAGLEQVWPALIEPQWRTTVEAVLAEATLQVPETGWRPTGGRSGAHTTGFGFLLAELQHLHRSHPGASW